LDEIFQGVKKIIYEDAFANELNVSNAAQMSVLLSYHQTLIDDVRSTNDKNAYRGLMVHRPSSDIEQTNKRMTQFPVD